MKRFYLILIAIFTLLSCSNSNDDEQVNNEIFNYTIEYESTRVLDEINIHLKNNQEILETFTVENSDSISVDFTKDDGNAISIEITDSSNSNIVGRYKIFGKCNGEVLALILDEGNIGSSITESISNLDTYSCE
ncbi:hypothetical protein [Tenacibaculum maritimum]|uniref:hypothetical protein n=1 Tax=Tenacibaculum maritimum TaxID=107401 RepID=UPI0012E6D774|nr:hypothetical protein [Tenacibaculum maritimum]CAA0172910.1 exported hypothetical protein [Tenacibaculum maritimum]